MEAASFGTQANALLRKNIAFQRRNMKANLRIVLFPVLLCLLLVLIQKLVDNELNKPKNRCVCQCVDQAADGTCRKELCSLRYSKSLDQVATCPIPSPPEWPPLLQVPRPEFRAAGNDDTSGLPEEQCRRDGNCRATVLVTGGSQLFAQDVSDNFFNDISNTSYVSANNISSTTTLGSDTSTTRINFIEPGYFSERPLYLLQKNCSQKPSSRLPIQYSDDLPELSIELQCLEAKSVWRNNTKLVNDELYRGYRQASTSRRIDEIVAAYDFLNTGKNTFNVSVWYNSTYQNYSMFGAPSSSVRVVRSVNVISNAYIRYVKGVGFEMSLDFIKEMPKPGTKLELDFSSLLGPLFFKWVIELIFPVLLTYLVYEKQYNLRIMMKMHGLGDRAYWIISYGYFLLLSIVYVLFLVVFGSIIGLKYFTMQDYSLQFVFYFAFINLQIALAFLTATAFSNVKSAQAIAYIYIFGTGLLAGYLLQSFIEDFNFSKWWIRVMELIPAFALYRGLYEFGEYAFNGRYMGTDGMRWSDLSDDMNGMGEVLIIITVEWIVLLILAYQTDQSSSRGSRARKNPFFFLPCFKKKLGLSFRRPSLKRQASKIFVEVDKPDVAQERQVVEQLRLEPSTSYAIVSDNLKKVYPGRDGNPDKLAVQGMSLAIQRGECFGMLGPNGAGKTTFIHMMIGLISPSSGNAYVEGQSIQTDMDKIYTSMGVCPQHDMLWEMLTAREHLLFYGRLKNLKGQALTKAVEESLKSVNLFYGGVADKRAGKYSGGMKRRLSVAISLIGDPKVVYMDEPSTGLDPASRNNLWRVIKNAKRNRAIILTTHSMEEAEVLCDRLGIFVGGALQCIGNPKQLKARYGETYVFTVTTSPEEEKEVESLVRGLSPNANKVYHISGTQKFEIPKQDVEIADVFYAMDEAKRRFPIQAWGIANTTLEDVFIKVAKGASSNYELS